MTDPKEPSVAVTGKHGAEVLRGGGRAWAVCICGWVGPDCSTVGGAGITWSAHMRTAQSAGSDTAVVGDGLSVEDQS